ncbi:MAG: ATP-binding protein [Synergistaceae bacterium]|nr:ATP-binding protein [Synergistaceae bacterium]
MFFERTLGRRLESINASFPIILITGPRQVGKTTLFEKYRSEDREYVSLDDLQERNMAQNDPALFLQMHKPPLFIDEVQYAPQIFPYLKMTCDRTRRKGLFWLTGSQQFRLMRNVSESLAGRVAILDLQGLSQAEKLRRRVTPVFSPDIEFAPPIIDAKGVFKLLARGSFPALYGDEAIASDLFYSSYVRTYIERDVRDLVKVTDEHAFLTFMRVLSARTAQLLNYTEVAGDVDVSVNTVKSWMSVLETSGLVYLLRPYFNNLTSRAIKTPKLYFMDTGLCCYLNGIKTAESAFDSPIGGALLETYVVSEILKSHWHNAQSPFLYFYRDRNQREIDLIFEQNGLVYPVEIKKSANPSARDIRNFAVLREIGKTPGKGAVVCLNDKIFPLNRDVNIIPAGCL